MFLTEVAERNDDAGGKQLAYQSIPTQYLHKKFEQEIVDHQVEEEAQ